jgi:hypothetical protein
VSCPWDAGPWMKLPEGIDFVREVGPTAVIPIHDGGLAAVHRELHQALLVSFLPDGTKLKALDLGETTVV